jgi:hypothetical protein
VAEPQDNPEVSETTFNSEKRGRAQELIEELLTVMGHDSPPTATPKRKTGGKTMGDVADRVLDMVSKNVATISKTVQDVAPDVWMVMIKQQTGSALGNIIPWIMALVGLPIFVAICTYVWSQPVYVPNMPAEDLGGNFGYYFWWLAFRIAPMVTGVFCAVYLIIGVQTSFKKLWNPKFYAVRDLFFALTGRTIPD